ncbi:MAG: signal peptidase II [Candidatus Sericytochromatia bacterium]
MSDTSKKNIGSIIVYITALFMFGLDQWSKQTVINTMPISIDIEHISFGSHEPYKFLPFLWFNHVVNFGSAFSSFYGKRYLLLSLVGTIIIGMIIYERKSSGTRHTILSYSLGFLLAGALGNWFDRLRLGYVTDFLDLRYNGQNIFPIFNVADVSVNIGIGLLIIYSFFIEGKIKKQNDNMEDDVIDTSNTNPI